MVLLTNGAGTFGHLKATNICISYIYVYVYTYIRNIDLDQYPTPYTKSTHRPKCKI